MKFISDLHIHSKYSRATAKTLDFEHIYQAARIKGITVVGTGDFTFPAWVDEIETKLEPAEPGLFALKPEFSGPIDATIPETCQGPVRFMLQTEISNIYKKDGRVRKNHNLIYFADLESVKRFNLRLDRIGNIKSDGRPILGLDAANLLEIMLETSEDAFFVPAHIWTPWFSMFGSKSGFDSMAQCFGDLKDHIFAVETGLSSDPPMNWRVPDLDHVRLISNSDAHSPGFLGRNATVFDTDLDYFAMKKALETNDPQGFQGTLDMYPHQGKYHYDGHRKCNVCLNPSKTAEYSNLCPECGRPLTLGVLYRVRELARRPEGFCPEDRHGYTSIIPLKDMLSEIFEVGPNTKKVTGYYDRAIERLGPELAVLTRMTEDEIRQAGVPLLAEAVLKMRDGKVHIDPGYDGEYGKVKLFSPEEKRILRGEQNRLFAPPPRKVKSPSDLDSPKVSPQIKKRPAALRGETGAGAKTAPSGKTDPGLLAGLNPEQRAAVESESRAVLIQAGPGTGKTRTLTARIAWLVSEKGVDPGAILALTFTNKAAEELSRRIKIFMPQQSQPALSATFHSFCLNILKEYLGFDGGLADDDLRKELIFKTVEQNRGKIRDDSGKPCGKRGLGKIAALADPFIAQCRQQLLGPDDDLTGLASKIKLPENFKAIGPELFAQIYGQYDEQCAQLNLMDFEDLIFKCRQGLADDSVLLSQLHDRFLYIFIDEYQDLNYGQYELVRLLSPKAHLLVIGDPDQSIYGFRGSDLTYFTRFEQDFPGCEKIRLKRNYRSTQTILDASCQMISKPDGDGTSRQIYSNTTTGQKLMIKETATENAEAVAIGKMIESLVGGLSFFSMDARSGTVDKEAPDREYSFSDFAVLYRTRKQCDTLARVFEKEGIPFQTADKKDDLTRQGVAEIIAAVKWVTRRTLDVTVLKNGFNEKNRPGAALDSRDPGFTEWLSRLEKGAAGKNSRELMGFFRESLDKDHTWDENQEFKDGYATLLNRAELFTDPADFMDSLALKQDPDSLDESVEKVSLMTIHSAKGLEFPVVFVIGCEQGMIPFARDGKTVDDPEEERRLFYVAMTRAKDILCLTYALKRRIYGTVQQRVKSPFLDDIERRLSELEARAPKARAVKSPKAIQLELF